MPQTTCLLTILAFLVSAAAAAGASLDIGDPAPPLSITEWVQGDPVSFKKDLGKKIYMVEFWATWCPPCKVSVPLLTQIQNKYKNKLAIIGVTAPDFRGNTPRAIRRFVKQQGPNMSYTVAIDRNMATTDAYLGAAEVMGIPHAFIVDKKGKIVWQGSPLDPALETVVSQVVAGTYDVATATRQAEGDKLLQRLVAPAAQMGRWQAAWDALREVVKVDPGHEDGLNLLLRVYIDHLQNHDAYRSWCAAHIAAHRSDLRAMTTLAEALCNHQDLAFRAPDLALEAAKAGYETDQGRTAAPIELYARAHYQIGNLDSAIALQEEAVAAAKETERARVRAVRDFYKKCRDLRAALK